MFTVVKNQIATQPTSHETFANVSKIKGAEPLRFDKMLKTIVEQRRQRNSVSVFTKQAHQLNRDRNFQFLDIKIGSKESFIHPGLRDKYGRPPVIIDAKEFMKEFLAGDK